MNPYKLALLALYGAALLITIAMIGKERKPLTPGGAVVSVVITAGMATLVVLA